MSPTGRFDVRRSADRFRTTAPGLDSRHSFSFGPHYDPDNLGFGPLLVSNEDRLAASAGYDRHAHRGVDIVTWMLAGTLDHQDSTGQRHALSAGSAQRLRAGSGVHHAEHAADPGGSLAAHYVQMWLRSMDPDAAPSYVSKDFSALLDNNPPRLVRIASDDATDGALMLDHPGTEFLVARLPTGAEVVVPAAHLVHLFVACGNATLDAGDQLAAGDAVRITGAGDLHVFSTAETEILVWRLPA